MIVVVPMKNIPFSIVVFLFSLIFICSCTGKPKRHSKPVTTVELSPSSQSHRAGQSLTLHIKTKLKEGQLKKSDVFLNNTLLVTGTQPDFSFTIPALTWTGINTLRIVSETTDGISGTLLRNFTVLSDIVPVEYTYTVIRELPHDTGHFTQGLEIMNGFLFEGTGETGQSALYKINISNGRVLQSVRMPDRYFGEGITIMGEKIYQLTYKDQVGFVYNLSDFAVIDSFRFESKEGWGLTNDGKNLIMSDGTGTLTFIDPADFSVTKKIQATDHQKVFQYLNELEYDHGFIWANIWGSEQILRIDAESGKVMGFAELKGLLGVMPVNRSDRIDVMNGIALMPSTGNFLITGKRWPRMFEVKISVSE